jgi:hypothetical protein
MSCLDATFTLTPKAPYYSGTNGWAGLYCFGADFYAWSPYDLSSLYAADRFYFDASFAADPNLDYSSWANRQKTRYLQVYMQFPGAAQKELALIFGFDVPYSGPGGRVLIYSDAGLLHDQTLVYGDSQFLLEIESADQPLNLYVIHAGDYWSFKGISGYLV